MQMQKKPVAKFPDLPSKGILVPVSLTIVNNKNQF